MTLGFVMLAHKALDRAGQVARYWAGAGYPVVIHVDVRTPRAEFETLKGELADLPQVAFAKRRRCEWGKWSIVAATLDATGILLRSHPDVQRVALVSGACLPLRPARELQSYLDAHPETDFIESVTTFDVPWAVGGLQEERFTLFHPLSWKRWRRLFDGLVEVQRWLRVQRRPPRSLQLHIGSQWWCLTRRTLEAILNDPERRRFERYFRLVWIPDESFFQTLARRHSTKVESRSLTLSKFDFQGRPHVFYDDHLELLRRSDCFLVRKVWSRADRLYRHLLAEGPDQASDAAPQPGKIDRVFSDALKRRTKGRDGLISQGRFPGYHAEGRRTATPYSVWQGTSEVFRDFDHWLENQGAGTVHGRLFHPDGAEFAGAQSIVQGSLSAQAALRDYNPEAFLSSLIWSTAPERQHLHMAPGDTLGIWDFILYDPKATVLLICGAWTIPLMQAKLPAEAERVEARRLQARERDQVERAQNRWVKARVIISSLADVLLTPDPPLSAALDGVGLSDPTDTRPAFADLRGLVEYHRHLRNIGLNPVLSGDVQSLPEEASRPPVPVRPYLVR
ncbi:MAG: beta-1,6-N-acetylglucosaminyltransferase [Pseudomonadota bacterium]